MSSFRDNYASVQFKFKIVGLECNIGILDAKVMLSANLWVDVGSVNGAIGTVIAMCYEGESHPS